MLLLHLGIPSTKSNWIPWTLHRRQTNSKDGEMREWLETSGSVVRCWIFFLPHIFQTWSGKSWQVRNNRPKKKKKRRGLASEDRKP